MDNFRYAVFPVDFEDKYKAYICKDENLNDEQFEHYYGGCGFYEFCRKVKGKTLEIKLDGIKDCFEVQDDNWCVPLSVIEVLD